MKYEYLQGFNDAMNGTYLNPYNDKTEGEKFMLYHNGHNSGAWHKRVDNSILCTNNTIK